MKIGRGRLSKMSLGVLATVFLAAVVVASVILSPGAGTVFTMVLTYSNSFVGSAEFTFQATGTS